MIKAEVGAVQNMGTQETEESPYVVELKEELHRLDSDEFTHARRLLNEEVKRVESGDKYKTIAMVELHHDRPVSNAIKVRIPIKEYPKVNFSGKLLGPKGSTMKQLQQDTGCKMSILGRGSIRDKDKEEELRKEGGKYAHLNEDLHVLVECFTDTLDGYHRIARALGEIKNFMNPEADPGYQMFGQPMDEGVFFNGNAMGRGSPALRGAPPTRGAGMMNSPGGGRGMPPARGGIAPPVRGTPLLRGGPPTRGAAAPRGAPPAGRGAAPGTPMRGMPHPRGAPMARGAPAPRGAAPSPRGRGMATQSLPNRSQAVQQEYDDYGAGGAAYETEQSYGQETYAEDSYARRDPYSDEQAFTEPAAGGGDTQFFDYGHGGAANNYDDYDNGRSATRGPSQNYDRQGMKASQATGPTRPARGSASYRPHPYDSGARRPGAPAQSHYAAGSY